MELELKSPKQQLEISHSNLLSKTCTFALKWIVSPLSVPRDTGTSRSLDFILKM